MVHLNLMIKLFFTLFSFNPLTQSGAVRNQKKNILEDLFSSLLSQFKKYQPPGNLKFHDLDIFQSLKLRISTEKIPLISLKRNFTPNTSSLWVKMLSLFDNYSQ